MESEFVAAASSFEQLPAPVFAELALVGRSNVGKSSLINTLLGRKKLARTSGQPGCTRSLNLYRVHVGPGCFDLIDLPGFGYAKRSKSERKKWQSMIESFLNQRVGLRGILLIVDIRRGLEEEERDLSNYIKSLG
ncbi:MAG: ribosome biogenesis GTP-binding protein YsxC [Myxococcales bacterium]|nr:MAG: ribosome biogenesis GTP-binding protein YsxC [Myxococcales bacterium]